MQQQLLEWIGRFSYPAVFLLLAGSGVGLPIPEEVVLVAAGVLCGAGRAVLWLMAPVVWLGVVAGDTLLFRIGARLGPTVIDHPKLAKLLTPARVTWVRARFDRFGAWTLFVVCFLPGLRLPTFLLAGGFGVTQRRFWLAEVPAVAIYAPLVTWLGATFGEAALPWLKGFGGWGLLGVAGAGALALALSRVRRRLLTRK